ncbi:hypothetical protein GN316_07105 [Xylophilus sp. Kf1]|nr:hypothetical protein [Xylophilus sp. Kf1]
MTTVVAVRKTGQVALAADALVTFGDTRLDPRIEDNPKIFDLDTPVGLTDVGMAGTVAHFPVLRKALAVPAPQLRLLGQQDEIFDTFSRPHPVPKDLSRGPAHLFTFKLKAAK